MNISPFFSFIKEENSPKYKTLKSENYQPILDFIGYNRNTLFSELLSLSNIKNVVDRDFKLEELVFNNPLNPQVKYLI